MRLTAILVLVLSLAGFAASGRDLTPLQSTRQAAISAYESGDLDSALALSRQAVAIARATPATPPTEIAHALSALAFLLADGADPSPRAESLWYEALALLGEAGRMTTDAGVSVLINLGEYELRQGRDAKGLARLDTALRMSRATGFHGAVALSIGDTLLTHGAFAQSIRALDELTGVAPQLLAPTFGDYYTRLSGLIDQAEQDGRAEDVVTLLEGKQIILRQYLPQDQATEAIRGLFFQRYFALRRIGDIQRVQNELTLWLKTGLPSKGEQSFIQEMVDGGVTLALGGGLATPDGLWDAHVLLAMTGGMDQPDDHRIGLAFRAVATAHSHLGQFDQVDRALGHAIDILKRSDAGRRYLSPVYGELAWNAFQLGDQARATSLFALADRSRDVGAWPGNDPEAALDRANDAANRARFVLDTGQPDQALDWVAFAKELARSAAPGASTRWPSALLHNRLTQIAVLSRIEQGQTDALIDPLLASVDTLRTAAPTNNAEFAAALTNTADTVLFLGRTAAGKTLLQEAVAINKQAISATAPRAIDTLVKLALLDLSTGNSGDAIAGLRQVADARKSPAYRSRLAEAAFDFELLAWALLDDPRTRTPTRLNEAFEALQWTQVTQSATALSYLETRLAIDDPARGALLRQRQNLVDAQSDTLARLALLRPTGTDTKPLAAQLARIETDLAGADTRLNALGLETGGIGRVVPVSISDVQAMLGPQEALITFLLPSLNPDRIAGLDVSSNQVIAVTADRVHVARIGEASRPGLNRRITAFRCELAISDPECARGGAQGLRGAMLEGDEGRQTTPGRFFDHRAAHALYDDLFGGIHDVLESHERLIIVPPADLLRLPFQALLTAPATDVPLAEAPWMIRQNAISVLPSVASLRALRQNAPDHAPLTHMLGFGDPAIGSQPDANCGALALAALRGGPPVGQHMSRDPGPGGITLADTAFLNALERLPDAVCELQAIGARFARADVKLHTGIKATESRLKALNASGALAQFDVLVFATHGLTAGEAGAASPGLVLTPPGTASTHDDGLLSAAEIAGLDLNAQLVVLSACNTAAGESGAADGLSGLARAFFRAGAQSLLVTHWSVYSQAAVDISTGLFGALEAGPPGQFSTALRAATLDILSDPDRPAYQYHPSYWAAFSIIGAN